MILRDAERRAWWGKCPVVLEAIVMIYCTRKVSSSIHSVGNKHKERNLYTVMSDNALNKVDVSYVFTIICPYVM